VWNLNPKRILLGLIVIDLSWVVAYVLVNGISAMPDRIRFWFNLDDEGTLPAWFSSAQLLILSMAAAMRAVQCGPDGRRFYGLMASVYLFFSADETVSFHEALTKIFKRFAEYYWPLPLHKGVWMGIYPAVLFGLLWLTRRGLSDFLKEKTGRTAYLLGASAFVTGGVVFEIGGYYLRAMGLERSVLMVSEIVMEEGLEMVGLTIMLYALLMKIGSFSVGFGGKRP
jgi:hypothetical protein